MTDSLAFDFASAFSDAFSPPVFHFAGKNEKCQHVQKRHHAEQAVGQTEHCTRREKATAEHRRAIGDSEKEKENF